jgi:hypothetical protein
VRLPLPIGTGLELQASLNVLAWNQVATIYLTILATVALREWLSARVPPRAQAIVDRDGSTRSNAAQSGGRFGSRAAQAKN